MRGVVMGVVAVLSSLTVAQEAPWPDVVAGAYRSGTTVERMVIESPRGGAGVARSEIIVAIRSGEAPAVALALGGADPLRILAEPGRLFAWRESAADRVFATTLTEPFGRGAIERVLPPLLVPQLDLAFAESPDALLAVMPPLSWSAAEVDGEQRFIGVAAGASLSMALDGDGFLESFEVRRDGRDVARASVERTGVNPEGMFDAPALDARLVDSLMALGRLAGPVREGGGLGQAVGTDARGRPTTLRALAGGASRLVLLVLDADSREARSRIAGALAEADLGSLMDRFDGHVLIVALGEPDSAAVLERVGRAASPSRNAAERVRAIALDRAPDWLPAPADGARAVVLAVDPRAWTLERVVRIEAASPQGDEPAQGAVSPFEASVAPRTLAERLAEAVGAAARD